MLVLVALAYVAFGLVTAVIGVVISRFQEAYAVPLWVAGLLPFAFYLAYGVCSIPFGLWMDRRGGRPALVAGILLMTLGCFLFYVATSWILMLAMVFLIGAGVTAIQTAGNPIIRDLDVPAKYSANLTIIIGIGALGYAISPVLVPYFESTGWSWQSVYLVFGVVNLALLVAIAAARFPAAHTTAQEQVQLDTIVALLKHPVVAAYALGIFMYVGAEVGVSSYIVSYMQAVHGMGLQDSLWPPGSFWHTAFPSASALAVALFWGLQAIGRIAIGPLMQVVSPKRLLVIGSGLCIVSLAVALVGSSRTALVAFALNGLFTCASFTLVFSAVVQSFETNHGTLSGILCTAVVGGAIIGALVGAAGEAWGMRAGMALNLVPFLYVFLLAVFGRGTLDVEPA
ncbi:MAG: MFS transporter [Acidobacteria bacterium]|nr:MFS transporter [Acidobacteriota bacterium]